jgi:hypothetical protein
MIGRHYNFGQRAYILFSHDQILIVQSRILKYVRISARRCNHHASVLEATYGYSTDAHRAIIIQIGWEAILRRQPPKRKMFCRRNPRLTNRTRPFGNTNVYIFKMHFVQALAALSLVLNAATAFSPSCQSAFGVSKGALSMSAVASEPVSESLDTSAVNLR